MRTSAPSASVIAAAVVGILSSVFGVLVGGIGILAVSLLPKVGAEATPPQARTAAVVGLLMFLALGIFGFIISMQVLRLKNWARISMIAWGALMAFFCGIALLFVMLIPLPGASPGAPVSPQIVKLILAIVYGPPILIGVWWLVLFSQRNVRVQFERGVLEESGEPAKSLARCPVPLAILAGFSIFSVLISAVMFGVMHLPTRLVFFGHMVKGQPAAVIHTFMLALVLAGGVGMLRLKRWSYSLQLALCIFWLASGTGSVLSPNYEKNAKEIVSQSGVPGQETNPGSAFIQSRTFGTVILMPYFVILWLLLYYHTRFNEACAAKEAERAVLPPT